MLYNYVTVLFFAIVGLMIPALLLLLSKLLGPGTRGNPVRSAPYESAELTVGSSRDIDNEYMPYFMLFLPFEIIIAIQA